MMAIEPLTVELRATMPTHVERHTERVTVEEVYDWGPFFEYFASPQTMVVLAGETRNLLFPIRDFERLDFRPEEGMAFDLTWESSRDTHGRQWIRPIAIANVLDS